MPQRQAPTREPTVLAPVVRPLLSSALAAMLDDMHAQSGAVYLLAPDEPVLEMAVKAGLPRAFTAPGSASASPRRSRSPRPSGSCG